MMMKASCLSYLNIKKFDMIANTCIIELLHLCGPYDISNNDNCHDAYVKMARLMKNVGSNIPKGKNPVVCEL